MSQNECLLFKTVGLRYVVPVMGKWEDNNWHQKVYITMSILDHVVQKILELVFGKNLERVRDVY